MRISIEEKGTVVSCDGPRGDVLAVASLLDCVERLVLAVNNDGASAQWATQKESE